MQTVYNLNEFRRIFYLISIVVGIGSSGIESETVSGGTESIFFENPSTILRRSCMGLFLIEAYLFVI